MSEHLTEATAEQLFLSDEERLKSIKTQRFIGYPRARDIIAKLDDLFHHPKIHRMPNMLIVGASNNGKTVIVNSFCEKKNTPQTHDDLKCLPVVYVEAPPVPDEKRFFSSILYQLSAPHKRNERPEVLAKQVAVIFRAIEVKMLIIDEIHHLLAGTTPKQRAFLNVLKHFGNEMKIPLVGVGTADALNALQIDEQLANRFELVALQRWSLNEDFRRLLGSFEARIPLRKPSNLSDEALALKLLTLSGGLIGELSHLLRKAAEMAIKTKSERITDAILLEIDWTPPNKRRQNASQVI
jgi:hypothetical protein